MSSYVKGASKRPPLGVRFTRNGASFQVLDDDGVQITFRDENSDDRLTFDGELQSFDRSWEPVEDVYAAADYIYRIVMPDESIVDSGANLMELPRVGQRLRIDKKGDDGPPFYIVERVRDLSWRPDRGGQAACEMWVRREITARNMTY